MAQTDKLLDHGISDESDSGSGYDSEAAERSKAKSTRSAASARGSKRRKLSHSSSASELEDDEDSFATAIDHISPVKPNITRPTPSIIPEPHAVKDTPQDDDVETDYKIKSAASAVKRKASTESKSKSKEKKPGVIYMSSLPPYLKPSALKHLLAQRGFEPVTRLFLTPASKHAHGSKKNSRQLYTEGWIEFASKKTAKQCAEALNAQQVGGKKGGFYYDDLWNMKYLRGMGWDELMEGVREEKREAEGRRDEERRQVAKETQAFLESVEVSKKQEGMKQKRKAKGQLVSDGNDRPLRDWRQHEVAGNDRKGHKKVDPVAERVLAQIF